MKNKRRVLIIGADGLRPDNISPEITPNYWELCRKGTLFPKFYSSYPSMTRVSISTLTTGAYPGRHGAFGNYIFVPGFPLKNGWVQTGDDYHLRTFKEGTGEPFLLLPTLGDRLAANGKGFSVASSGSPGSALIWNINNPKQVLNPSTTFDLAEVEELHRQLGSIHTEPSSVKKEKVLWSVKALTEIHLPSPENDVMVVFMAEPDSVYHSYGMGSPEAIEALGFIDGCVGEVLSAVQRLGLEDQLDIIFISDHGHANVEKKKDLGSWLKEYASKQNEEDLWFTSDYYIYFNGEGQPGTDRIQNLIDWLYEHDWCGPVFAHPQYAGELERVISMEAILGPITHNRIPVLAVNPKWSDDANQYGVPGTLNNITKGRYSTHGSLCPYEMNAFCLGYGPSFKESHVSYIPCGIVDIAPTVCHIAGISETGFDGRILFEGLKGGQDEIKVTETELFTDSEQTRGIRIYKVNGTSYVQGSFFNVKNKRGAE